MSTREHAPAAPRQELDALRVEPTFSGSWTRLDRLSSVRPGTVVVVAASGRPPRLKSAGELLVPAGPLAGRAEVLVVTTQPVVLQVRIDHLTTLDGEELSVVELEVSLRVDESRLLGVVVDTEGDLNDHLVLEARRAIAASVRAAAGLNRASDLRRTSLADVLEDHWLPASFASGALVRTGIRVRRLRWPNEPDPPPQPPRAPAGTAVAATPLRVATLASRRRSARPPTAAEALELVHVPAAISVSVFWVFFVAYWIPELGSLSGVRFVLEQLAPVASVAATGPSQPVLASQAGESGLAAGYLLVVSLLLPPMARTRHWWLRLLLWPLTYLAVVDAAVLVIGTTARGRLAEDFLGVLLLVVWSAAAVITTWRSLWVDPDELPRRPAQVMWLLGAFALVSPAPIAVGRAVFAPGLRTAARGLLHNGLTLRCAALLTPTTALVYLCGVLLAVLVWAVYELWPPRAAARLTAPSVLLAVTVLGLALLGPQTGQAARQRAEVIRTQSPRGESEFSCGVWTRPDRGQVVQTLVVSGGDCTRVTAFRGYQQVGSRTGDVSLSPVRADTLDGQETSGKLVSGQYGQVLVLAATDRRDHRATQLLGLGMADGRQLWRYVCPAGSTLTLRLAGTSQGDDSALARLTRPGERAGVLARCGTDTVRLDPATGRAS